jgi:hypothetical protein
VRVIVPDLPTARYLDRLIGSSSIQQIGDLAPPQRPKPLTQAQKAQRLSARKHRTELLAPKLIPGTTFNDPGISFGLQRSGSGNLLKCLVTFHSKPNDSRPEQFKVQTLDVQEFIQVLRTSAKAIVDQKEEQYLFNGAIFSPNIDPGGYRRKANFLCSFFLVLDFDNGELSAEQFIEMFWDKAGKAQKKSFIIYNTFSRSIEQPNRFRVILLYRRPAVSIAQHQVVYDAIVERLRLVGFDEHNSGLDPISRSGIQSYYMPGTNRAQQDSALFVTRGTKTAELRRFAIDPSLYGATASQAPIYKGAVGNGETTGDPDIAESITKIRSMKQGRHKVFWDLALKLGTRYRCKEKVQRHLNEVASGDPKLIKKANDAIKSLRSYGII